MTERCSTPPGDGLVYLCRASGEGTHDFRICLDEASVGAFYQEMTGEDEGGGIDSLWRDFRDPDCWGNDGTALELELYCAKFEVWKVDAQQLTVVPSETAPLADALAGLLAHCDYTSDCETDYEKAVHAGRAALNAYIKSVTK